VQSFGPDSELRIALRPAHDVAGPVDVAGAIVDDGRARPWHPPVRVSPSGVVEIAGVASELLGGAPGERDLVLAVGQSASLPTDATAIASLREDEGIRVFRAHVRIVAR
jgi:hypothetical protein